MSGQVSAAEVAQWIAGYLGLSEVEHDRIVTAVRIRFEEKKGPFA